MRPRSYEEAGVSIARGDAFASYLAGLDSPALGALGGFAGGHEIDLAAYSHPVLLSTTDGVGTKLLVAKALDDYTTVGIDLVAMSVNDLCVCGADPTLFLDYIACGRIDERQLKSVARGIVAGCEEAGCVLAGGETAELPDMYGPGDIDLAGFAVGIVERDARLPHSDSIRAGDAVVGLASSGVHSNGFSLARKVAATDDTALLRELLTPTRIYVRHLAAIRHSIKAAAHITGGGLEANLMRVVPRGLKLDLSWDWPRPAVFDTIASAGSIPETEMRSVFNMGIGIAMIVRPELASRLESLVGEPIVHLGSVIDG